MSMRRSTPRRSSTRSAFHCRRSTGPRTRTRRIAASQRRHSGALDALRPAPPSMTYGAASIESLDRALTADPSHQVPGASAMLARLREDGHTVAFATGCWEASARLKLTRSFIEVRDGCLVACDEEPDRVAILRSAMRHAAPRERVLYVGDGPWDVQAARRLQLPVRGFGPDDSGRLRGHGVGNVLVLRDFHDYEAFLGAVARAMPPAADDG